MRQLLTFLALFLSPLWLCADIILQDNFEYGNTDFQKPVGWYGGDDTWVCGHLEKEHNRKPHQGEWYMFADADERWVFIPTDFIQGIRYNLSFWSCSDGAFELEILAGLSPDPGMMSTSIMSSTLIDNEKYQEYKASFDPTQSGFHYIGFHSRGIDDAWYINIDDVVLELTHEYDFIVETLSSDTTLFLGESGDFRFLIKNTGYNTETVRIVASPTELFSYSITHQGSPVSTISIEPSDTCFIDVRATLSENAPLNAQTWLDVNIYSTHNCHTGLATFWVTPMPYHETFPLIQNFDTDEELTYWTMRSDIGIMSWKRSLANQQCSPYNQSEAMLYYPSETARLDDASILITPKLHLTPSDNVLRFMMYRTSEMPDRNDRVEVYLSPSADYHDGIYLETISRCSSLHPATNIDGWQECVITFNNDLDYCFIILRAVSANGKNIYIDQLCLDNTPLLLSSHTTIQLIVSPIPTNDIISCSSEGLRRIVILDINGKPMTESDKVTDDTITIDIAHLSKGIYVVRAETNNGLLSKTIIKN